MKDTTRSLNGAENVERLDKAENMQGRRKAMGNWKMEDTIDRLLDRIKETQMTRSKSLKRS